MKVQEDIIPGSEKIKVSAITPSNLENEPTKNPNWNKTTKTNLFAACYLWAMSGFATFLIMFFSKYFEGNFFLIYGLQG